MDGGIRQEVMRVAFGPLEIAEQAPATGVVVPEVARLLCRRQSWASSPARPAGPRLARRANARPSPRAAATSSSSRIIVVVVMEAVVPDSGSTSDSIVLVVVVVIVIILIVVLVI